MRHRRTALARAQAEELASVLAVREAAFKALSAKADAAAKTIARLELQLAQEQYIAKRTR